MTNFQNFCNSVQPPDHCQLVPLFHVIDIKNLPDGVDLKQDLFEPKLKRWKDQIYLNLSKNIYVLQKTFKWRISAL